MGEERHGEERQGEDGVRREGEEGGTIKEGHGVRD